MRAGFRWWRLATAVSVLGDGVAYFALAWVAAGLGPGALTLVTLAESVPLVAFILVGGAVADRVGPRRMMIGCDLAMVAVMAGFAVAAARGVTLPLLVAVALLAGTAAALRRPSEGVFPRLFFTGDALTRALASTTLLRQLATTVGPALGGVLVTAGLAVTAGLNALTFAALALTLTLVRPPGPAPERPAGTPRRGLAAEIADGVRSVRAVPGAGAVIATVLLLAVTVLPLVGICVPLLGRAHGWSAGATGLLPGAWVLGGMAVLAVVARTGPPPSAAAVAGPGIAAAGALAVALAPVLPVAVTGMLAVGVGTSLVTARLIPRFLDAAPPGRLARLSSLLGLAQTAPVLLATLALGALAALGRPEPGLLAIAAVLALATIPIRAAEHPRGAT